MNEQIKEMAKDICLATQNTNYSCKSMCKEQGSCAYCIVMAESLYNANCRKHRDGELIYEVKHFFDDYGDLIVYVIAHCTECGTQYRENRNIDYERIERPDNLDYHADWNIDVEPIKKKILERAKTKKLLQNYCPNCGAEIKGGAE